MGAHSKEAERTWKNNKETDGKAPKGSIGGRDGDL